MNDLNRQQKFSRLLASSDAKLSFSTLPALHLPLRSVSLEVSKLLEVGKNATAIGNAHWVVGLDVENVDLKVGDPNIDVCLQ